MEKYELTPLEATCYTYDRNSDSQPKPYGLSRQRSLNISIARQDIEMGSNEKTLTDDRLLSGGQAKWIQDRGTGMYGRFRESFKLLPVSIGCRIASLSRICTPEKISGVENQLLDRVSVVV